jgi:putative FmdB family regulatory protein
MPAYDYVCMECGRQFEVRMSMAAYGEGSKPPCPHCASTEVERSLTAVNVLTGGRGSGGGGGCGSGSGFT